MTYRPQQPPVGAGATQPPASWTPEPAPPPPPAKSRAVPVLLGIIALLLVAVGALSFALLRSNNSSKPATTAAASAGAAVAKAKDECGVVAGFAVEDAGQTLNITVGSAYMNETTAGCLFDHLGVPDAVREHVASTRALDGQQTDQWAGYTARWTFHPDAGLKMTIRAA